MRQSTFLYVDEGCPSGYDPATGTPGDLGFICDNHDPVRAYEIAPSGTHIGTVCVPRSALSEGPVKPRGCCW